MGYVSHMPPEWWSDHSVCDQKLDIYSFGITLYQMINKGKLPFVGETVQEYEEFHRFGQIPRSASPLFPVIDRCLKKDPSERYHTFVELRQSLEKLLVSLTGKAMAAPVLREMEYWEWNNKGRSRIHLQHYDDAIRDFKKALENHYTLVEAWGGLGICYHALASVELHSGNRETALRYRALANFAYENATLFDYSDSKIWHNWGNLHLSGRLYMPALECYEWALQLDPGCAPAWINKADAESDLGREQEAIRSYQYCLELADPAQYEAEINFARKKLQELTDSPRPA
jgi:tetratricopeptide (TPR) repeat protein